MRSLSRLLDACVGLCAGLSAAILAAIALGISVNVVLRSVSDTALYGLLDLVEYGLLTATFLGAPWVLARNAHVSVDLVTASLPRHVARPLARLTAALGLIVSAVFLFYAIEAAMISAGRGSMIRQAFVLPEWWTLAAAPVGFALICAVFIRQLFAPPEGNRDSAGL